MYSESQILKHFDPDLALEQKEFYPRGKKGDISYHFWLDLEHGYFNTAGSRIHLYADEERWVVVTEKSGYNNRGTIAEIELDYFGNCIDYIINTYPERSYISNAENIVLIGQEEWDRICNKEGEDMDQFEVISPEADYVMLRDVRVPIEQEVSKYRGLGIHSRKEWDENNHLVTFEDLIRYYNDTSPEVIRANENEIREHIPADIPKLMTIDEFHFTSAYAEDHNPSKQELYQLIAKTLVARDVSYWKPSLVANNHWSNWDSGNL